MYPRIPLSVCAVALVGCLHVFVATSYAASSLTPRSLLEFSDRLRAYSEEFLALKQAHRQEPLEYEIASDMFSIASLAHEYVDSSITLLQIYHQLSCQADRAIVPERIMNLEIPHYAKQMAILGQYAQSGVAHTKVPGFALSASKLRDDLRQLGIMFEHPMLPN